MRAAPPHPPARPGRCPHRHAPPPPPPAAPPRARRLSAVSTSHATPRRPAPVPPVWAAPPPPAAPAGRGWPRSLHPRFSMLMSRAPPQRWQTVQRAGRRRWRRQPGLPWVALGAGGARGVWREQRRRQPPLRAARVRTDGPVRMLLQAFGALPTGQLPSPQLPAPHLAGPRLPSWWAAPAGPPRRQARRRAARPGRAPPRSWFPGGVSFSLFLVVWPRCYLVLPRSLGGARPQGSRAAGLRHSKCGVPARLLSPALLPSPAAKRMPNQPHPPALQGRNGSLMLHGRCAHPNPESSHLLSFILSAMRCRVEREEQSAKGPFEAIADTLKGAADFVKWVPASCHFQLCWLWVLAGRKGALGGAGRWALLCIWSAREAAQGQSRFFGPTSCCAFVCACLLAP